MRPATSLVPVLSAILACGPGSPGSAGTTDDSSSATGTTTTGPVTTTTTGPDPVTGTTTGPDPVTGTEPVTGTTGPDPVSGPTTDPDPVTGTTTGDTTGTTTDTTTGGPGETQVVAFYVPGGLDRIFVNKADFEADLCTSVIFVWPMAGPDPNFMLPPEWGYQGAAIAQGAADCLDFQGFLPGAVMAAAAKGAATWPAPMACPGPLDIDVALTFEGGPPWVPAQDHVQATGVEIQGC